MKRARETYPEDFERVWKQFDVRYGPKGSKPKALKAFLKLECNEGDINYLITRIAAQKKEKDNRFAASGFFPNFPHVERWLRDNRFDDELLIPSFTQQSKTNRLTDRSWAGEMGSKPGNIKGIERTGK